MKPWLRALATAGHEVRVVGPTGLAPLAAGFDFIAGAEPDPAVIGPLWQGVFAAAPEEREQLVHGEVFARTNAGALRPAMEDAFEEFRPDLVLRDPTEWASAAACVRHDVRQVRIAISLAASDQGLVSHAAPIVDEWVSGTSEAVRAARYLTRFPASLDPAAYPATRRYRLGTPGERRVEAGFVYATLGTEAAKFSHLRGWYDLLAGALAGRRALFTVGRGALDPASVTAPEGVLVADWADHSDVLGRAAVVVHHGGSGTTLDALAAGCPQVVVPLFADQPANAAALAAGGLAVNADRGSGFDMRMPYDGAREVLRDAIDAALASKDLAPRAREVAAEMAALPELDLAMLA